jgi:O-antigen ligase
MTAFVIAATVGVLLLAIVGAPQHRPQYARWSLWWGVLGPAMFNVQRSSVGEVTSTGLGTVDILRAAVPAACLIAGLACGQVRWKSWGAPETFLMGYLSFSLASLAWSVDGRATFLKSCLLGLQYLILIYLVRSYSTLSTALRGVASFAQLVVLLTFVGLVISPGQAFSGSVVHRLVGLYPYVDSNILALLATVSLLSVVSGVGSRITGSVPMRSLLLCADIVALVLSRSRAALTIGVLLLALMLVQLSRQTRAAVMGAVGFVLAAAALVYQSQSLLTFLQRGQTGEQLASLTGRVDIWTTALDLARQHPWIGLGYYSGHRIAVTQQLPFDTQVINVDNVWVESLIDLGVVGLTLLLLVVTSGVLRSLRARRTLPYRDSAFLGTTLLLATISTLFNPSLQTQSFMGVVFAFVILAAGLPEQTKLNGPSPVSSGSSEANPSSGAEIFNPDLFR